VESYPALPLVLTIRNAGRRNRFRRFQSLLKSGAPWLSIH
jgi:hypothetical protein